jgi:hypothetical protein
MCKGRICSSYVGVNKRAGVDTYTRIMELLLVARQKQMKPIVV